MSKNIFIFGFFVTCVWNLVCSYSSGNCPIVELENGHVKFSAAGRITRFFCNRHYVLVGSNSAVCSHGRWNYPPPFCARTNCSSLGRMLHGQVLITQRGALAIPTCDPDFSLIGSPSLLCTDNGWNDTLPVCRANSLLQFGTCHFEPKENQECNWILRPALYKWALTSSDEYNSSNIGYYPGFDHTLGPHAGGHYLYLKNTMPVSLISLRLEQRPDNGAKYISPLFPPVDGTGEWCLIFFIYCFGPNAGNVTVTINNDTVWENTELVRSNMWTKVTITLVHQRDPFRITIIGKGHLGQFSNTAIDDLRIAHGADCLDNSDKVLPYSVQPGLDEVESTTSKNEYPDSHEIYKRETTTLVQVSGSTRQNHGDWPAEITFKSPTSSGAEVTTARMSYIPATNNTESRPNATADSPLIAITEKLPSASETIMGLTWAVLNSSTLSASTISNRLADSRSTASSLSNSSILNPSVIEAVLSSTDKETSLSISENENRSTSVINDTILNDSHTTGPSLRTNDSSCLTCTFQTDVSAIKADEASTPVSKSDNQQTRVPITISNNYQTTKSSPSKSDSSCLDCTSAINLQPLYNSTYISGTPGAPLKSVNLVGWSDFEKSMIYVLLVIASTVVLIVTLIVIRYRRNYQTVTMSDNKATYNCENVAFLNGVELLDKY